MANNCRVACDIPVMGMGTQSKNNRIFVSVTDPIQGCVNIKTDTYASISSTLGTPSAAFKKFDKPVDQMNCPEPLCITTGTLDVGFVTNEEDTLVPTTLVYNSDEAAIDYVNGVVSLYAKLYAAGSYDVAITVGEPCESSSVTLTQTIVGGESDIYPKEILIQKSLDEALEVLSPTDCGMTFTIEITPNNAQSASNIVGISSLSMVKDKVDFEQNETIQITCVDELDFPNDIDLTDPTCLGQAPDETSITLEMTITAEQVTGNWMRLNSLLHKTDETKSFAVECYTKTIAQHTVNGTTIYGIRLPNFFGEECSFVSAYLPACDAIEGRLNYSSIANMTQPDFEAFKVITDEVTGDKYVIFNEAHNGYPVMGTYPIEKSAIVYEANTNFVEGRKIRILIPFELKNGYTGFIRSDNAFCTSFPFGFSSTEDTPMEFTFTFMREKDRFYHMVLLED